MTVTDLASQLNLKPLAGLEGAHNEVTSCYAGDLLSWVMGRAKEGSVWLTVMGNINAVAVATLADCACIVLTENAPLDEDARLRADMQNVPIYSTEYNAFEMSVKIAALLNL